MDNTPEFLADQNVNDITRGVAHLHATEYATDRYVYRRLDVAYIVDDEAIAQLGRALATCDETDARRSSKYITTAWLLSVPSVCVDARTVVRSWLGQRLDLPSRRERAVKQRDLATVVAIDLFGTQMQALHASAHEKALPKLRQLAKIYNFADNDPAQRVLLTTPSTR